jgi:hypothetical protein
MEAKKRCFPRQTKKRAQQSRRGLELVEARTTKELSQEDGKLGV